MIKRASLKDKDVCVKLMSLAMQGALQALGLNEKRLGWCFSQKASLSRLSYENISVFVGKSGKVLGAMGCADGASLKIQGADFAKHFYIDFIASLPNSGGGGG